MLRGLENLADTLANPGINDGGRILLLDRALLNRADREANQRFYGEAAETYATERAWMPDTQASIRQNLLSKLLNEEDPILRSGLNVLVVGAGTGSDQYLLQEVGLHVVGVDLSREMLVQAGQRVKDHLTQAEAEELPFGEGTFDFVYCEAAGEHFDVRYLIPFIREMRRVLNLENERRADALVGVREGNGRVVRVTDVVGGTAYQKYFATYTGDDLRSIFEDLEVDIVRQWRALGGTPGIEAAFPWINNLIKFRK